MHHKNYIETYASLQLWKNDFPVNIDKFYNLNNLWLFQIARGRFCKKIS